MNIQNIEKIQDGDYIVKIFYKDRLRVILNKKNPDKFSNELYLKDNIHCIVTGKLSKNQNFRAGARINIKGQKITITSILAK